MHACDSSGTYVGLLGLETTGLTDRSIALDILHALSIEAGLRIAFHLDCAFDDIGDIWNTVAQTAQLDILAISLRTTSGILLPRLKQAIDSRIFSALPTPLLVFGGQTALASPDIIKNLFPNSLICTLDAELSFPAVLSAAHHLADSSLKTSISLVPVQTPLRRQIIMPAQFSTERAVRAGGTIWIEASRGCRLRCSFCVLSNVGGLSSWVPRHIEGLFDEIQYISEHFGVSDFSLSDFSAFESESFIDAFIFEHNKRNLKISFRCDMRLGTAERFRHRLPDLYKAGLRQVYVGVESLVPKQQQVYKKGYPGKSIIDYMQSLGIGVIVGFIMLDPLASRADFRRQVIGIREEGLLGLISTPFKTMRIQRGTEYEQIAIQQGIVEGLNPDLYSYSYRCLDPALEAVRQVVDFFHQTTKVIYYNPYIENMLRCKGDVVSMEHINVLQDITSRYKNAEYRLLDETSSAIIESDKINSALPLILESARRFSLEREMLFERTAKDYDLLLNNGIRYYRDDLEKFLKTYRDVPSFESSLINL